MVTRGNLSSFVFGNDAEGLGAGGRTGAGRTEEEGLIGPVAALERGPDGADVVAQMRQPGGLDAGQDPFWHGVNAADARRRRPLPS